VTGEIGVAGVAGTTTLLSGESADAVAAAPAEDIAVAGVTVAGAPTADSSTALAVAPAIDVAGVQAALGTLPSTGGPGIAFALGLLGLGGAGFGLRRIGRQKR